MTLDSSEKNQTLCSYHQNVLTVILLRQRDLLYPKLTQNKITGEIIWQKKTNYLEVE